MMHKNDALNLIKNAVIIDKKGILLIKKIITCCLSIV